MLFYFMPRRDLLHVHGYLTLPPELNSIALLYHITTEKEWAAFEGQSQYAPAAFSADGFIHASRFHQLAGVLKRYYEGRRDLLLLRIDEAKLNCSVIYEPAANKELYPHLYGTIAKEAIIEVIRPFNADILESINSLR
jgi:uncharacterized protein (DUF952 family)